MKIEDIAEALVVRPGDTLVVRADRDIDPREFREFALTLKDHCAKLGFEVIVMAADQIGVVRAGEAEA